MRICEDLSIFVGYLMCTIKNNRMKKSVKSMAVCLIMLCLSVQVGAQSVQKSALFDKTIHVGARLGMNVSAIRGLQDQLNPYDVGAEVSYNLGVVVDVPVMRFLSVQPGLYLTTKGFGGEYTNDEPYNRQDIIISGMGIYLEVPVLAVGKFPVAKNFTLRPNIGPYFAYGIGGNVKKEVTSTLVIGEFTKETETDYFGYSKDAQTWEDRGMGMKRFDCGISFGFGANIWKFYTGFQCEVGLINIADPDSWGSDASFKTGCFSFNLGYNF